MAAIVVRSATNEIVFRLITWVMDQRVKMNRLVTAVAIGMRRIAGKTQSFTGVYGLPYPTSTHVQPTLNHHHMFDNAGFMRR